MNNAEEIMAAIRQMESLHQLYVVGRGHENISGNPLTAGLRNWADCPELGPIGDVLASSDFTKTVSVLVVQQYVTEASVASPATHQTHRHSTANNSPNQRMSVGIENQRTVPAAFGISR